MAKHTESGMTVKNIQPTASPTKAEQGHKTGRVFIGRLQPSSSRAPGRPPVDYSKGGDDFRCPKNTVTTSSFGRQVLSFKHTNTAPAVRFPDGARFFKQDTVGVGPNSVGQMSSMGKQVGG